jgi:hypothetical protein
MTTVTLTSVQQRPLRPLVEAALENQLRLLKAGIERTEARLKQFETAHDISTEEFVRQFEGGQLEETLELVDWIGEYRMLLRLQDKAELIAEIKIAD